MDLEVFEHLDAKEGAPEKMGFIPIVSANLASGIVWPEKY